MNRVLFFIIGVVFTLLIISAESQRNTDSINTNTFQTISLKNNTDCIITTFNFILKPVFNETRMFRLKSDYIRFSAKLRNTAKLESFRRIFQLRNNNFSNPNKIPHTLILYSSSDTDDYHKLS